MTIPELHAFVGEVFPQIGDRIRATELGPGRLVAAMAASDADLRPGGTVSGPTLFTLADCAFYMLVLAHVGREALAVTTNVSIDFMRKPAPGALVAEARMLKLGRALAVGDVLIRSPGVAGPVARASLTYSIPPARAA
jgi:uncharacterized protein (TIGR00369 family)